MRALVLLPLLLAGCVAPGIAPEGTLPGLPIALPDFSDIVVVGDQGNEPVVRVAPDGTIYVAALDYGYVSTDGGKSFQVSDFKGQIPIYASDSALAVAPNGRAYVTFDWPYVGQTAVCATDDRGASWDCVPIVVPGATDRMWIVAPTDNDVAVITGQTLDRPTFAVSHDAGKTWTITDRRWTISSQGADLAWDPVRKVIVEGASEPADAMDPLAEYLNGFRIFTIAGSFEGFTPVEFATDEMQVAVGSDGVWWANACAKEADPCEPAVATSADGGSTWDVIPVPKGGPTRLLPFVAARGAGSVAAAWYETDAASADDATAEWRVVAVRTNDAGATWVRTVLTEEPVHVGAMCRSLSCLGEDRYAGDFLGVAYGPDGSVHVTWNRQTAERLLPQGQQRPPLPAWEQVEYARAG